MTRDEYEALQDAMAIRRAISQGHMQRTARTDALLLWYRAAMENDPTAPALFWAIGYPIGLSHLDREEYYRFNENSPDTVEKQ